MPSTLPSYSRCGLVTLLLLLPLSLMAGQITLSPMTVKATAGQGKMPALTVSNLGEEKAYVKTEVREILFPNTAREKEVAVSGTAESDLIASPARFILPPEGQKKVRLVYVNQVQKERVYRVYATPIIDNKEQAELAKAINREDSSPGASAKGGVQTSLSISIAWGALVRMLPDKPVIAYKGEVRDGQFYLVNTGNVRFHVSKVQNCTATTGCPKIDKEGNSEQFNIYPDLERQIGSAQTAQNLEFDIDDSDGGKVTHILARDLLNEVQAPKPE